jgi:hypothetical protein
MDDIAIDIIDSRSPTARVEGRLDPLWAMIAVPELRGHEEVLPPKRPRLERFLHRIANRIFIAVTFRTIEMSKSRLQCSPGGLFGCDGIRNQRAKPDSGDRARPVSRNFGITKRIGCRHCSYSLV